VMSNSSTVKRAILAVACALALTSPGVPTAGAETKPGVRGFVTEAIEVEAKRLDGFERGNVSRQQFGKLEFRGGLVLNSPSTNFGGWSGLELDPGGKQFLAIGDAGAWMTGELVYDGNRLKGIRSVRQGPILGVGGKRLPNERDRDAEAVRLIEGTLSRGAVLVSFEQNHRIGRFEINDKGLQQPSVYAKRPPEWSRLIRNRSLEALAVVRGGPLKGAIVAFAEKHLDSAGNHTGWVWPGGIGGEPQRLSLRRMGEFDLTDAASLPDGSLVVLERSFAWFAGVKMRLRLVKGTSVKPGALLDGEVLLEANMGYEIDNMEGLAVHPGARGESILTLISDNNFNGFLQRTLMLQFALTPDKVSASRP
jgi:hypothetical protein